MSKNSELQELYLEKYHQYFDVKKLNNITIYICKLCSGSYSAFNTWTAVRHYDKIHKNVVEHKRYPLKPWKDSESLFCDTDFLRKIIGKEPAKGDECRDTEK